MALNDTIHTTRKSPVANNNSRAGENKDMDQAQKSYHYMYIGLRSELRPRLIQLCVGHINTFNPRGLRFRPWSHSHLEPRRRALLLNTPNSLKLWEGCPFLNTKQRLVDNQKVSTYIQHSARLGRKYGNRSNTLTLTVRSQH